MLESRLPHLGALATSLGSSQQRAPILETSPPEAPARPWGPGCMSYQHPCQPLLASLGPLVSFLKLEY